MIRTSVPAELVAGDTWRWTRDFADYPAGTWTVTYYFENERKQFSKAATVSGTAHAVQIDATDTTGYPPGRYRWFARAVSGSIVETIDGEDGWLEVLPNPAATGTRDLRTWSRRALDAVLAAIEGKATSAQQSFSIASRTVASYTLTELWKLKADLEAEVRTEEQKPTPGGNRNIKVRLKRA